MNFRLHLTPRDCRFELEFGHPAYLDLSAIFQAQSLTPLLAPKWPLFVGFDVPVFTLFAVLTLHKGLWGVFDRKTLGCYLLQEGRLEFRHVFQLSSKLLKSP